MCALEESPNRVSHRPHPRLLFASYHCCVDPSSGAAMATRDLLVCAWDARALHQVAPAHVSQPQTDAATSGTRVNPAYAEPDMLQAPDRDGLSRHNRLLGDLLDDLLHPLGARAPHHFDHLELLAAGAAYGSVGGVSAGGGGSAAVGGGLDGVSAGGAAQVGARSGISADGPLPRAHGAIRPLRFDDAPKTSDASPFGGLVMPMSSESGGSGGSGGNSPPVATDDSYGTLHDTTIEEPAPDVMANDWDYDEDPLTASLVSGPAHAQSFTFNSDGSFSYEPQSLWAGTDGFVYEVSDGNDTDEATVTIYVTNEAPWTADDYYSILHDTTLDEPAPGVIENDWDYDDDPITATLVTGPNHADDFVFNSDGSFTYTPAYAYVGTDTFTYRVSDQIAESNLGTATIYVTNEAPMENPIEDVYHWAQDPADEEISLWQHFEDPDDTDQQLSYSVPDNTNPAIVGTSIDAGTGILTLSFTGTTGVADLTVRATDRPGEHAETTFAVYVVEVTDYTLQRQKPDGTWVTVPDAEVSWSHDTLRWTAVYEPAAAEPWGVDWLNKSWDLRGDPMAPWNNFASAPGVEPTEGNPGTGEWAIAPDVHFPGVSVRMTPPERKVVAQITSIDWVVHGDPAFAGELLGDPGGPRKLYPDAPAPGESARAKVDFLVTVEPKLAGIPVAKRWYDVDDPSDHDGPTHVNETDNRSYPPSSPPDAWGPITTHPTDANGELRRTFNISGWIQPGNNWRYAAGGHQDELERLKPVAADEAGRLFYDKDGDGKYWGNPLWDEGTGQFGVTPRLTVWRKLHVEVDSMGAPPPGTTFPDDGIQTDVAVGDLRAPYIGLIAQAFEPAYVTAVVGTENDNGNATFQYHLDDDVALEAQGNANRGTSESAAYWSAYIQSAYEYNAAGADNDPNYELATVGHNHGDEPEYGFVFLETMRDLCDDEFPEADAEAVEMRTVVHEIGHQFECPHSSGSVMDSQPLSQTDSFSEDSLKQIRSVEHP
jgi:hypothetical protein